MSPAIRIDALHEYLAEARAEERQKVLGELRERVKAVKREPRYSDFVATVAHENACDDLLAIIDELAGSE